MPALKKTTASVAAAAAVIAGLTVGGGSPAGAAPDQTAGVRLTIHEPREDDGFYEVRVSGVFPMSQADAQRHVADLGNGGVKYDLVHDDAGADDTVKASTDVRGASRPGNKPGRYLYAASDGLRFAYTYSVPGDLLDEDESLTDGADEIYVRAWFVDRDNHYQWGTTSDVVVRDF
jgi:hypothetical protein